MKIKILGSGCRNCQVLYRHTLNAIKAGKFEGVEVEKVEDIEAIMSFGISSTPGFVIDEKVVSAGRVLKEPQIVELIHKHS